MPVDWKKLDDLILQVVSASASEQIAEEEFEQGLNVSKYPQLKVMFDGFGDDGDDESMRELGRLSTPHTFTYRRRERVPRLRFRPEDTCA